MSNQVDALVLFGGLAPVILAGALFAAFPMYQLLDMSVVRRPVWNPPRIVVREPLQGLNADDVARMEQDPRQKEFFDGLRKPIIYSPKPSWLGYEKPDPNQPAQGRRYPSNGMLYLFAGALGLYIYALKYRGIL